MKQEQRDRVMQGFRTGKTEILVATDVAARGIDVDEVEAVFNYDLPQDDEYYVQEKTDSDEIYSKENNYGWEPVGEKFRIQIDEDLDIADKIIGGAGEPTYIDLK